MVQFFDPTDWGWALQQSDWHKALLEPIRNLMDLADWHKRHGRLREAAAIKEAVRGFFQRQLERKKVSLPVCGPNLDAGRGLVDTVVIHHASTQAPYTLGRLNVTHLLNLYVLAGNEPWSGHFDEEGHPVFYGYHWLVEWDGTVRRLLRDNQIGWHAGNREVNARSVGICLNANLAEGWPSAAMLEAVQKLVRTEYPRLRPERLLGHGEVSPSGLLRACPGGAFLGPQGWKRQLVWS